MIYIFFQIYSTHFNYSINKKIKNKYYEDRIKIQKMYKKKLET